jgi:hypothetical protein
MSRVGEAIREEQEAQIEELERLEERNIFEAQAMLDAMHYASLRQVNAERFKNGDK